MFEKIISRKKQITILSYTEMTLKILVYQGVLKNFAAILAAK
jgi:hypothetical protein